jgi:hypothetical protein
LTADGERQTLISQLFFALILRGAPGADLLAVIVSDFEDNMLKKFFREVGIEIASEVSARAEGSRPIAAKFLGPFSHIT